MHVPKHFEEKDLAPMQSLMQAQPLATLIVHSSSGLVANHIPMQLHDDGSSYGTLRGHIARINPLMRELALPLGALAIFHGPEAYITPNWYMTKQETGRVVPTWNYAVVHAHGTLRLVDDPLWLFAQLSALTNQSEANETKPWAVEDAPPDYIAALSKSIVGIELTISGLTGKWKVSQNQPTANQNGIVNGLESKNPAMATLVKQRGKQ